MKKITVKRGEEKIKIPQGVFVNGYIINATINRCIEENIEYNNQATNNNVEQRLQGEK